MSGIYIPGVEKTKTCAFCRFCDGLADTQLGACAFCVVDGKAREADITPKDCPLIPVPDHGRLIDADALYEKFLRLESESMSALQTTSVGSVDGIKWSAILTERTGYKFDIVDAPTVIPASGDLWAWHHEF